jgi:hypothetical protein
MMDAIRRWWYESNAKKSRGGFIFMMGAVALFVGVIVYIVLKAN